MNFEQLLAVLKLRWQISRNQWRKLGAVNAALMLIVTGIVLVASVAAFFSGLILGYNFIPAAKPDHLLLAWDVIVTMFLCIWVVGVMTELQQSELLSLERFLHLPVSLFGAYLLNYFSIWLSLSLLMFLPLAIGLSLAHVVTQGPRLLLVFPLVFGFVLMVTALTYQFRGWLAQLMQNKRRKGTIAAVIAISFMVLTQLPNLINLTYVRASSNARQLENAERTRQLAELTRKLKQGEITTEEFSDQLKELSAQLAKGTRLEDRLQGAMQWLRLANMVLPIGWLPYGVYALAEGSPLPALLGSMGLFLITAISLRRSYRSAMKACVGENRSPRVACVTISPPTSTERKPLAVEWLIPGFSESVSTIALCYVISLLRSAEGKMMLMTPVMFLIMFGGFLIFGTTNQTPSYLVPGFALLTVMMSLVGVVGFLMNSFGFDRGSFRAYILMPVSRCDLLKAKNLGLLPLLLLATGLMLCLMVFCMSLGLSHFLATLLQAVVSFLLLALVGNLMSIQMPLPVQPGTIKPTVVGLVPILAQFLVTLLIPLSLLPAVAAWGLELLLEYSAGIRVIPVYLLLSIVEVLLAWLLYSRIVIEQGNMLHQRETRVLEAITSANE